METNQKTKEYFFKKFFDGNNLRSLVIPFSRIKKLDKIYKDNFQKYSSFDEFENDFPNDFIDFRKSKSAYEEIKKQFSLKIALQASILTECYVAQTIANVLSLNNFVDIDANLSNVPTNLLKTIYTARGYTDGSKFRYCYYDDDCSTVVFQCGASGTVDIVFNKYNYYIRLEVKEQKAKLEECDITGLYNEYGKLLIDKSFFTKRRNYIPYIENFNECTNVFDTEGHNYKIEDLLTEESIKEIIKNTLNTKVIDVYIFVVEDQLVPVYVEDLVDFVNFTGSEIRTSGRNKTKLFTREYAKKKIEELGGCIKNEVVIMPYDETCKIKERNKKTYGRYGIGSLLFIYLSDAKIVDDNLIVFNFNKIYQKIPTISIHLNAHINYDALKKRYSLIKD